MTKETELSIVTVTFRDPAGLAKTLESLQWLKKAQLSWEHVIVDGSPELNSELISKLTDWPLKYLTQDPQGIYPAMNEGIRVSSGIVLHFLNGGDCLVNSDSYLKLLNEIKENQETDLIWAGAALYRNDVYLYSKFPKPHALANLIGFNHVCHQAILYRKGVFDRVGLFATHWKYASDYEHHYRCWLTKLKIKIVPICIADFDMSGGSSQYKKVLGEFYEIHKSLSLQLPSKIRLENNAFLLLEFLRVSIIKTIAATPLAFFLRPLWLKWNNRKKSPC